MKILRIVKKNARDVLIKFDNDEVLILVAEVFLKSGLKKGDEISQDRFSLLIEQNKIFHIKQKALRLLARRPHSVSELKKKLWNKDYEPELIQATLNELIEINYLNDEEFASLFAEEKLRTQKWSEKKLQSELVKRGVDSKIISKVLKEKLNEEIIFRNANSVAVKKYQNLMARDLQPAEIKNKLFTFLNGKGYDYDTIIKVYENLKSS